jgi:stage V sporulation protein B
MKQKNNKVLKGVLSLSLGAFIAKLLGALYRIPLSNILGGFGLGLYQIIFPIYAILLDFSGAGVPSALSRLISESDSADRRVWARKYLSSSIKLLSIFGVACSILLLVFSRYLVILQGNVDALYGYLFIAPAIFFVAVLSCYRGYFQGLMNMTPTAVSQIVEQVVKLVFGILFSYVFRHQIKYAVAGATFSITLSEAVALVIIYLTYKRDEKKFPLRILMEKEERTLQYKKIFKTTVPITFIGIMIPLSHAIDSFIIINILSSYRTDATELYGLLTGVAYTLVNLPVSICYGIAQVTIPAVAGAKTEIEKNRNGAKTLLLTLLFSVPCTIGLAFFSSTAVKLLFHRLSSVEQLTASRLTAFISPTVILLSLLQTSNAVLIGKNKARLSMMSLSFGIIIKTVLNLVLLKIPELNIYGGAIALIACYFVVCLVNFIIIFNVKVNRADKKAYRRQCVG